MIVVTDEMLVNFMIKNRKIYDYEILPPSLDVLETIKATDYERFMLLSEQKNTLLDAISVDYFAQIFTKNDKGKNND